MVRLSRIRDPGRPGFVWPSPQVLPRRRPRRGWHEKAAAGPGGGTRRPPLWGRRAGRDGGSSPGLTGLPWGYCPHAPESGAHSLYPETTFRARATTVRHAPGGWAILPLSALAPLPGRARGARTGSPGRPLRRPPPGHHAPSTSRPGPPRPAAEPRRPRHPAPPTRARPPRRLRPRHLATGPSARATAPVNHVRALRPGDRTPPTRDRHLRPATHPADPRPPPPGDRAPPTTPTRDRALRPVAASPPSRYPLPATLCSPSGPTPASRRPWPRPRPSH